VQKDVQLRRIVGRIELDHIGRHGGHIHRGAQRHLLDDPVVEQVAKHGAHGADRERRAHESPPRRSGAPPRR
jgi:hypothetical protein